MTDTEDQYKIEGKGSETGKARRIAFIKKGDSTAVKHFREETVMSAPDLLIRGVIAFEVILILLGVLSYVFNAPLEEIANPGHTPNPAKAPWYFLGLQELLHYFHPIVAGILIPALLVIALAVIPYFRVNIERKPLWGSNERQTFLWMTVVVFAAVTVTGLYHAWAITVPTLLLYLVAALPVTGWKNRFTDWLARRSLPEWIMTWFVTVATLLTVIGTFFRGPGWSWVWPW